MSELVELRERVRAASVPDRDLDWAIWFHTASESAAHGTDGWPRYTASIDAALSLGELLPGWHCVAWEALDDGQPAARVTTGGGATGPEHRGSGATLPLALLDALLAALIAKQEAP